MAVADVAHRYGIPVIVAEAGADDITARGYPEVFRIAPAYSMLAQIPARWLKRSGRLQQDGAFYPPPSLPTMQQCATTSRSGT